MPVRQPSFEARLAPSVPALGGLAFCSLLQPTRELRRRLRSEQQLPFALERTNELRALKTGAQVSGDGSAHGFTRVPQFEL
jgi:Flp pilus assembly protein TadB